MDVCVILVTCFVILVASSTWLSISCRNSSASRCDEKRNGGDAQCIRGDAPAIIVVNKLLSSWLCVCVCVCVCTVCETRGAAGEGEGGQGGERERASTKFASKITMEGKQQQERARGACDSDNAEAMSLSKQEARPKVTTSCASVETCNQEERQIEVTNARTSEITADQARTKQL
eukprot:6205665-Pleurochrysis_carterae.AAC.2